MRKFSVLAAVVIATGLLASTSFASISGSAHDFGTYKWSNGQICGPCHAPHNTQAKDAQGNVLDGPLWNHQLSVATYTMYYDLTGKAVTGNVDQNSKLCLSCHDGTVALDSFGGGAGTAGAGTAGTIQGLANLGTDLSNDHPIGDHAIWPTGASYMVDPALRNTAGIMPLRTMADGVTLVVGCTSCHEPHNRKATPHLLWVNNFTSGTTVDGRAVSGSLLCMNCHKK